MHLKYRSNQKEFLDEDNIEAKHLFRNLKELDVINTHLGGYRASLKGMEMILEHHPVHSVMDIGFGGGDSIKQLARFSEKRGSKLFFYGVDLKKDCFNYASENLAALSNKELICDDYRNISSELLKKTDVIHCSLFLHHLTNAEIVELFKFAKANNCIVLANDLHRNWLAYQSIKFLTALFSRSYLVKNDAAVSVTRGFRRNELIDLLKQSGFTTYSVTWSWAFRYIIIAEK
jgi:2-polyprenyl-3-methyl-5-hydroxy-6-metoxy-1,4-benzoquinol methylase